MNDAILLNDGMQVLIENLGLCGATRFVYLLKKDRFDYTEWHGTLSEGKTVEEIYERAKAVRERSKKNPMRRIPEGNE